MGNEVNECISLVCWVVFDVLADVRVGSEKQPGVVDLPGIDLFYLNSYDKAGVVW